MTRKNTGTLVVTDDDRDAPDAARRLARKVNKVPLPKGGVVYSKPSSKSNGVPKITHKLTERKTPPRSFRLSESAFAELESIGSTLGIVNDTTTVEMCIHMAAQRLGIGS